MRLQQIENFEATYELDIDFGEVKIERREIDFSIGYKEENMHSHFSDMVDEILKRLPQICEIKAGYRIVNVKKKTGSSDGLIVGGKFFEMHKIVTSQLRKAEQAALFVCTIGPAVENWAKEVMAEGDPTMSYLIDTVASVITETATNTLHDFIGDKMAEHNLKITNRYSPGYCNWSVAEQHLLFSLLPKNFCGISLTESALMTPIKSVSGIIGIGKEVKYAEYLCDRCGVKDCTYRSKRETN